MQQSLTDIQKNLKQATKLFLSFS